MSGLRVGVLGLAHAHGPMWARAFAEDPGCVLGAIYEPDPHLLPGIADELQVTRDSDLNAFLASGIDAVAITSEHADHPGHIVAAAEAGLHILCEKPLAIDTEGARIAEDAIDRAGTRFMQGFQMRLDPANQEVHRRIEEGLIGDITSVIKRHSHAYGLTGWPDNSGSWFFDPARSGGGAGLDEMIHTCDWARWNFGEPVEVIAMTSNAALCEGVDDQITAVFRMRGGALVTLVSGWTERAGIATTQISGTLGGIVELYTDLGSVRSGRPIDASVLAYVEDVGWTPLAAHSFPAVHAPVAHEFVRCLNTGDPFPSGFDDGVAALRMVLDAYESARTGALVRCEWGEQ